MKYCVLNRDSRNNLPKNCDEERGNQFGREWFFLYLRPKTVKETIVKTDTIHMAQLRIHLNIHKILLRWVEFKIEIVSRAIVSG